jgi:hypothetical protein
MPVWLWALLAWLAFSVPFAIFVGKMIKAGQGPDS